MVQVFAWGRMFAGYVQTMSVREALAETFDAEKPCSLCCAVREAKQKEQKQLPPEIRLRDKLVMIFQPTQACVAIVSNRICWPVWDDVPVGRGRAEPVVPPPRDSLAAS